MTLALIGSVPRSVDNYTYGYNTSSPLHKPANNRRDYQDVCSLIGSLIKDGGTAQASEVITRLLSMYPRKLAFREELRKITGLG
jgi:hypothetical protein